MHHFILFAHQKSAIVWWHETALEAWHCGREELGWSRLTPCSALQTWWHNFLIHSGLCTCLLVKVLRYAVNLIFTMMIEHLGEKHVKHMHCSGLKLKEMSLCFLFYFFHLNYFKYPKWYSFFLVFSLSLYSCFLKSQSLAVNIISIITYISAPFAQSTAMCNTTSKHCSYSIFSLTMHFHRRRRRHPTPVLLPGKSHGWEPGGLQSMGSLRVRHDWATSLSLFTFMHWRRKGQPTPVFLPGESQGRGSLVGCHLWGRTESDMTEVT